MADIPEWGLAIASMNARLVTLEDKVAEVSGIVKSNYELAQKFYGHTLDAAMEWKSRADDYARANRMLQEDNAALAARIQGQRQAWYAEDVSLKDILHLYLLDHGWTEDSREGDSREGVFLSPDSVSWLPLCKAIAKQLDLEEENADTRPDA